VVFRDWCGEHKFSSVSPTLPQFLDFNFLFSEKKFSVQAVKGYRSAISSTLHLLGSWCSDWDIPISSLTQNMTLECPQTRHSSNKWDISVVLRVLMGFPMEKVRLKYLTFKTIFLVALAKTVGAPCTCLYQDCLPRGWAGNPRICPRIPGEDPGS
jgi:hypothetical protein